MKPPRPGKGVGAVFLAACVACMGADAQATPPTNPFYGCYAQRAAAGTVDPEVAYHCFSDTDVELWSPSFELVDRAPLIWVSVTAAEAAGIMARDGHAVHFTVGGTPGALWDTGVDRIAATCELSPVAEPAATDLATARTTRAIPTETCALAALCQQVAADDLGTDVEAMGDESACSMRIGELLYLYMHFGVPAPLECEWPADGSGESP